MRSDLVDFEVVIFHETEKAWLVESMISAPKRVWVPKSLCEVSDRKPPAAGTMTMSESMAVDKGLV